MKTPVNFELAKLLKEKGFDTPIRNAWYIGEVAYWKIPKNHNESNVKVSAPTIADVVMWLYEKYGIWIYTKPILDGDGEWIFKGYVKTTYNFKAKEYQTKLLRLPTEAYEGAIEYTLKNLINECIQI